MTKNAIAYNNWILAQVRRKKITKTMALAKLRGKRMALSRKKASATRGITLINKTMSKFERRR